MIKYSDENYCYPESSFLLVSGERLLRAILGPGQEAGIAGMNPISSPSKKAKKVSQEIAPPQRASSSSDNKVKDSLVSCG